MKFPIDKFYTNNINKFGFSDMKGNVFQYNMTTDISKKIIENCTHLYEYKLVNNNYSLVDFYSKHHSAFCTSVIDEDHVRRFYWKDTTLYQTVYSDVYYRFNYFGDVYVKLLKDESKKAYTLKLNAFFSKYEYLQKVYTIENTFLLSIIQIF